MTNDFEDELRATMRDHDHEAPAAAALPDFAADDGPRLPTGGRYTWLPIAAAAAAVATLVGITFALGPGENRGAPTAAGRSTPASSSAGPVNSALTCPAEYVQGPRDKPWVPTQPRGVDGKSRLAPLETPTHVVICAYTRPATLVLTGSREITGGLADATQTLAYLLPYGAVSDHGCASYSDSADGDNYLIGLTYQTGSLWVSAPGDHCEGAGNGEFLTDHNLRGTAEASYRAGRWTEH